MPSVVITHALVELFGGEEKLRARIDAFKAKLEAHRFTVDEPAPTEDAAIEYAAKSPDGFELEPPPPPPPPVVQPGPPPLEPVDGRQRIRKSIFLHRLLIDGKIDAALAAFAALDQKTIAAAAAAAAAEATAARVEARDQRPPPPLKLWATHEPIFADDAVVIALLRSIGADPAVILAPEGAPPT